MIKNPEALMNLESDFLSRPGGLPHEQSQKLFAAMWQEGVALGVLPPADPLAGIEVDIRIARILNACLTNSSPG